MLLNKVVSKRLFKESKLCVSLISQFYSTDKQDSRRHKYDYIVLGLGAMGSSTLYHLAKNNSNVLGLEQFSISHSYGSSHGLTRIIRLAYHEHPAYVDMLRRSYTLWNQLEKDTNETLLTVTGGLDVGRSETKIVRGSKLTCDQQKIPYEYLTQDQLIERFPGWRSTPKDMELVAVYQPDAGILNPEKCVSAHVNQAKKLGATVRDGEEFLDLKVYGKNEVLVKTSRGEYLTSKVILSSGAWLGGFLKRTTSDLSKSRAFQTIASILKPERNVVTWYKSSNPELYQPHNFPIFVADINKEYFYGFPIIDSGAYDFEKNGFKIGKYNHRKESLSSDMLNKEASWRTRFDQEDENAAGRAVQLVLKDAYGPVLKQVACIFTNTPDEHFIIDPCVDSNIPSVALLSCCSGHGFKFSSVIGEIMATLVDGRQYSFAETDWLRAKRFYK